MLGECPSLAEKHNCELVPFFLSLAGPDATSGLPRQKLPAWLALFAKFTNPKALHSTAALHALCTSLLSHPDRALQKAALSCLLTYKSPHLALYEDKFQTLLNDTQWWDELTMLDFDLVQPQGRKEVVDVLTRLLFGLMLERKGRSQGGDCHAAVLGALVGCTEEELGLLMDLMLRPLGLSCTARRDGPFILAAVDAGVSDRQQTGFLTLLGDVLKNLGPKLVRYWPALLGTTINLIAGAHTWVGSLGHEEGATVEGEEAADEEADADEPSSSSPKVFRSIRHVGLKRFADFFQCPVPFDYSPYIPTSFTMFISPRLSDLDKENTQAPSALLQLFYTWSIKESSVGFLVEYNARVLPKLYDCLIAPSVKLAVISRIFDVIDHLLAVSTINKVIRDTVIKPHVLLLLSNLAIWLNGQKGCLQLRCPWPSARSTFCQRLCSIQRMHRRRVCCLGSLPLFYENLQNWYQKRSKSICSRS